MPGCANKRSAVSELNAKASLPDGLPFNPFEWKVIASTANDRDLTMSTLFGNELAASQARSGEQHDFPPGAVLSFVTWIQEEDDHWFGARVPGRIKSVEFVSADSITNQSTTYSYAGYEGTPLRKIDIPDKSISDERVNYVLKQRASVMP